MEWHAKNPEQPSAERKEEKRKALAEFFDVKLPKEDEEPQPKPCLSCHKSPCICMENMAQPKPKMCVYCEKTYCQLATPCDRPKDSPCSCSCHGSKTHTYPDGTIVGFGAEPSPQPPKEERGECEHDLPKFDACIPGTSKTTGRKLCEHCLMELP